MNATRLRDGKPVTLIRILPEEKPYELDLTQYFSSPEVAGDPSNHCASVLEVIETPTAQVMVMPFFIEFNYPSFQSFGEVVAFVSQILEVSPIKSRLR